MKIIRVEHREQSANRVFQYLMALRLAELVEGARVLEYDLDIFGVRDEGPEIPRTGRAIRVAGGHRADLLRLAWLMNTGVIEDLTLCMYGLRMEYLPHPGRARALLGLDRDGHDPDDCLYLHVRGADILQGAHPDYAPLPIAYYRAVLEESGLRPVFIGQLDESAYCQALRAAFPDAEFRAAGDPLDDFRTLMRGRQVATSISTFSWLAAWISPVAERIFMPVAGMLHPQQRSDIDLLPLDDPRYRFRILPPRKFTAAPDEFAELIEKPDRGRWVTPDDLRDALLATINGVSMK